MQKLSTIEPLNVMRILQKMCNETSANWCRSGRSLRVGQVDPFPFPFVSVLICLAFRQLPQTITFYGILFIYQPYISFKNVGHFPIIFQLLFYIIEKINVNKIIF